MPDTLTSGAVGLYWDRLDSVGRSIQRQAPPHPPGKAGKRTVQLFHALHALHDEEQPRSPEDVAAMIDRWVAIEEEVAHILHENSEPSVTTSSSWADAVPALSSPLRVLTRLATTASINVAESLLDKSPAPRQRAASLASGLGALSRSSSATCGLDETPEPQRDGGGGGGGGGGGVGAAGPESGDDDLLGPQLEAVRETLLAKACLGLLHWWLMVLLDLCFSAEAAAKLQPEAQP